jgi:putative protein kinase ArgK-like GTPase of G3E family
VPELWTAIRAFLAHTAPERTRRRAAQHEYRLRELLARRFLAHVEGRVLDPGEFGALVERIGRRELDPYAAAAAVLRRALKEADRP